MMNIKHPLELKIYREFQKNPPRSAVLAGVSGGADSMSLLHILMQLQPLFSYDLHVAHIHHGLRQDTAQRDADFVKAFCSEHDIPFHLHKADVKMEAMMRKVSVEEAGRIVRYQFFNEWVGKLSPCTLMTAHNLNDQAETFLLNLCRGAGVRGLSGIPSDAGIMRPFLNTTRGEIEAYCKEEKIEYCHDETNDTDDYTRNFIRHQVLVPLLEKFPSALEAVGRTTEHMKETDGLLDSLSDDFFAKNGARSLPVDDLLSVHTAVRHRILQRFGEKAGLKFNTKKVMLLDTVLNKGHGSVSVGDGMDAVVKNNRIILSPQETMQRKDLCLPMDYPVGTVSIPNGTLFMDKASNVYDLSKYPMIDCDKIVGSLVVRNRRTSDCIKLANRPTKRLKKLMNEARIPPENRDDLIILSDDMGVVFAEGFGVAQRVSVLENTESAAVIMITRRSRV